MSQGPDFIISDHGSILILNAISEEAKEWASDNLPDDAQTWGPHGTVVEPRYIGPIIDGIQADGLTISA